MMPGTDSPGQPLRLRANWKVVESKCLTCGNAFAFGEDVCACTQCGGYHHARCWDDARGCSHAVGIPLAASPDPAPAWPQTPPPPPLYPQTMAPPLPGMPPPPFAQPALAADEQYCPGCRNIIKTGALRCRFCNYNFSFVPGMPGPMFTGQPPVGGVPYGGFPPGGPTPYGAPYPGLRFDLEARAAGARTCGLLGIILFVGLFVLIFILAAADARDRTMRNIVPLLGIVLIASLVLAIVAVVRGHGAKRLLEMFPLDYTLRGRTTMGIVTGWIVIGLFGMLLIIGLSAAANLRH